MCDCKKYFSNALQARRNLNQWYILNPQTDASPNNTPKKQTENDMHKLKNLPKIAKKCAGDFHPPKVEMATPCQTKLKNAKFSKFSTFSNSQRPKMAKYFEKTWKWL